MFGFLNVRKIPGPTSHDLVDAVRRRVGRGVKVGHAGTLDPFAAGVLVICVGPATRLADYVQAQPKRYLAAVTLGATSTTDDPEGEIAAAPVAAPPSEERVRAALAAFVGEIRQVPPAHSAVHVAGRRAYSLARAGQAPDLPARHVTIESIALTRYEYPFLEIDVTCGSGTYIRSLARDVGSALGTGGYCSALTRSAVGPFRLEDGVAIDALDPARDLIGPLAALESLPRLVLPPASARELVMGKAVRADSPGQDGAEVAVVDQEGRLIAIALTDAAAACLRPTKVFPPRE